MWDKKFPLTITQSFSTHLLSPYSALDLVWAPRMPWTPTQTWLPGLPAALTEWICLSGEFGLLKLISPLPIHPKDKLKMSCVNRGMFKPLLCLLLGFSCAHGSAVSQRQSSFLAYRNLCAEGIRGLRISEHRKKAPLPGLSVLPRVHNRIIWRALENTEAWVSPPEHLTY